MSGTTSTPKFQRRSCLQQSATAVQKHERVVLELNPLHLTLPLKHQAQQERKRSLK